MTYNQVVATIETILQNHNQINDVRTSSPLNWLNDNNNPIYPVACFTIDNGQYNTGREIVYRVNMWFLDKSGMDLQFEQEVTSDMVQVGFDVINEMRQGFNKYGISSNISWNALTEKFEDYITGITLLFDFSVVNDFTACDSPTANLLVTEDRNILLTEDYNFIENE